jgi:nucleotide-binding universal stress UspA family protein
MQMQRILCPVDFSDLSALALRHAGLLVRCSGAKLTVAFANTFSAPPYFTGSDVADLEQQFRASFRAAELALRDFVQKELGTDAAGVEVLVVEGLPADGIRRLARDTKPDLIVMGTHGRSGVNRFLLGSVAERVLRESEVPVLTVRGDTAQPTVPPKRILCPVNDTPAARAALSAAADLAACFGAEVLALHVKEKGGAPAEEGICATAAAEVRERCNVRELTREGEPATEIIALARQTQCDLLVIGAQHKRFFDTTVLGSTTARVVRHAPCPVLTVNAPAV